VPPHAAAAGPSDEPANHVMPRRFRNPARALVAIALGAATAAISAAAASPTEHQVKAAFLYNFANFVEWPSAALGPAGTPLRVCVIGADPFGGSLDEAFRDQLVQGRKVQIARGQALDALGRCHILFLPQSEQGHWQDLVRELRATPTLTVGDGPPLARQGGIINFVIEAQRVRFEINPVAAEQAGLRISSKLLTLAKVVPSS
jgi:hypothetical protein